MAEAFYNELNGTDDAISAGVDLENSVKGNDPTVPELVVEVMKEKGIDVQKKRRDVLTEEMVQGVDKVVVITDHAMPSYVEESSKTEKWLDIPDAVRTPIEFHRTVRDKVEERVRELLSR